MIENHVKEMIHFVLFVMLLSGLQSAYSTGSNNGKKFKLVYQ